MTRVDILIPAHNEEKDLPKNVPILREFLSGPDFPYEWRIVIGDNGSTDRTSVEAKLLVQKYPGQVEYFRIEEGAKGKVVKQWWLQSPMDVVSFMDADLSTGLSAFPALIRAVAEEGYDVAVGSRLAEGAQVSRSFPRRALTRGYNGLIRAMFFTRFTDAQCGFKAMRKDAAQRLLPLVKDERWFFDTELLILAEKLGYRIRDIPITWTEDRRTSVKIANTVMQDLKGLVRMRLTQPWRRASRDGATSD
jgi:glycosyltransferase involved in cell wall biosynthesis